MTPDPQVELSLLERAERLDIDAQVEHLKQNYAYAQGLAREAHHLRMQYQQGRIAKDKPP